MPRNEERRPHAHQHGRPFHGDRGRDEVGRFAGGGDPRDDRFKRDRERRPEIGGREIEDDNRFSTDDDDRAGRSWRGVNWREREDESQFTTYADEEDDDDRGGPYRARGPRYEDRGGSVRLRSGPARMAGSRDLRPVRRSAAPWRRPRSLELRGARSVSRRSVRSLRRSRSRCGPMNAMMIVRELPLGATMSGASPTRVIGGGHGTHVTD